MSFTCYPTLTGSGLGSEGPPAQISLSAYYFVIDTSTNAAVKLASGEFEDVVTTMLATPVTKQADVLPAVTAAIQAREPATPGLTFIWIGL